MRTQLREIPIFCKPVIGLSPRQHIVVATSYPVSLIISHFPPWILPSTVILTHCFCLYMVARKPQICHFVGNRNLFVYHKVQCLVQRPLRAHLIILAWCEMPSVHTQIVCRHRSNQLTVQTTATRRDVILAFLFLSKWKTLKQIASSVC